MSHKFPERERNPSQIRFIAVGRSNCSVSWLVFVTLSLCLIYKLNFSGREVRTEKQHGACGVRPALGCQASTGGLERVPQGRAGLCPGSCSPHVSGFPSAGFRLPLGIASLERDTCRAVLEKRLLTMTVTIIPHGQTLDLSPTQPVPAGLSKSPSQASPPEATD